MKYIYILLLCLSALPLAAQVGSISAPCARVLIGIAQDSVEWSAQPCATFSAYEVFGRRDSSQPFLLLATITDPNQQSFVNPNAGEGLWEYRLTMLCTGAGGQTTIVVSNRRPVTPNLRRVYIANNVPILEWDSSPSVDVVGYQVYKENPYNSGNFFPYPALGQLQTGNQFVDAAAPDLLVRYAIVAVSPCNKSLLGEGGADSTTGPHSSIFIAYSLDTCAQALTLSWNGYENWAQGVEGYEILAGIDGGNLQVIDTAFNTSYTFAPVVDNQQIRFTVRAIESGRSSNKATSNEISLLTLANRPMDFCYLTGLTVTSNNEVEISWIWDTDTDFASAQLLREQSAIFAPTSANQLANNYLDPTASVNSQSHSYQVKATDACGFERQSAEGKTIFLQVQADAGYINRLSWSNLQLQDATIQSYQIFRVIGGNAQRIAVTADTSYNDALDISQNNQANACYYIVANATLALPARSSRFLQSRSNTACAQQNAAVQFPNAFAPNGHNRVFKPVLVFGRSLQDYNLQIFDRYGQLIFSSSDIFIGWDGRHKEQAAPQGVYVYRVQYKQPDGQTQQQQGTLMLLR